jgi:uncharacterized Zn finger protein
MARRYDYGYGFFPRSKPRKATGGIKAQSKRGAFGTSWWAKRWIEVLESFNIGARLGRGRTYARKGQVLSVDIGKGTVAAEVQGSRSTPYKVKIEVKTLSTTEWKRLAKALSGQAVFAAKLLAGEMPQDIETAFDGVGLSLFPAKHRDLKTHCSCPDWSNPCKHIAAVYYLLGEEFDRDPFLIFRLRGMDRDELVELIGSGRGASKKKARKRIAPPDEAEEPAAEEAPPAEPLPSDPETFWSTGTTGSNAIGEVRVPPVSAALPKRRGAFPFWRAEANFQVFLSEPKAAAEEPERPRRRSTRSKRAKAAP